jgi:hypothetical protein
MAGHPRRGGNHASGMKNETPLTFDRHPCYIELSRYPTPRKVCTTFHSEPCEGSQKILLRVQDEGTPRWRNWQIYPATCAPLAEPADAHASGACIRKDIEVQILWGAHVAGHTGGR